MNQVCLVFLLASTVVSLADAPVDNPASPGDELLTGLSISQSRKLNLGKALDEFEKLAESGDRWWTSRLDHLIASDAGKKRIRRFLGDHGLVSEELTWLDDLAVAGKPKPVARLLILQTVQLLRLGPERYDELWPKWDRGEEPGTSGWPQRDSVSKMLSGKPADTLDDLLASVVPQNRIYRELQQEFVWMNQHIESLQTEFLKVPPIENGEIVRAGDEYAGAQVLRRRLREGDYLKIGDEQASQSDGFFGKDLSAALERFQEDHRLAVDGILGPNTLAELNRGPLRQREILRINLHRARTLPSRPGKRHLIVNVASARLEAFFGQDTPTLSMKTIVGRAVHDLQTPLFRDSIQTVQFGPHWNVPLSIARDELVPKERSSPGYLTRNGFEIVSSYGASGNLAINSWNLNRVEDGELFLRQRPGPENALGRVKFLFPNAFAIYLHDTPADRLFDRAERDFSHGCIRVADPAALAFHILEPQGWQRPRIEQILAAGDSRRVAIENPPGVYLIYLTAYPTWNEVPGKRVRFEADVYGRDEALLPDAPE